MKKRILSLLLAICFVAALLPIATVQAEEYGGEIVPGEETDDAANEDSAGNNGGATNEDSAGNNADAGGNGGTAEEIVSGEDSEANEDRAPEKVPPSDSSSSGGSSSYYDDSFFGGSSSGSSTTTTTEKNPDGSTTTTVTDKTTGAVTETTTSQPVTDEAGNTTQTITETVTNKDGSTVETVTETVQAADGSSVETATAVKTDANGVTTSTETVKATDTTGTTAEKVTETNAAGETTTTVEATVSEKAVTAAAESGAPVTLPVEVPATKTTETAPVVSVEVPVSVSAEAPAKVEIPVENVTPGTVAVLVHADGTEKIIKTSVPGENGVVLTVDGSTTVKIVDNAKTFDDVQTSDWHSDAVDFVSSRELLSSTSISTFAPKMTVTGGMLSKALDSLKDDPDTTPADSNGTFSEEDEITREQLAVIMWRDAGCPDITGSVSSLERFVDADKVSSDVTDAMRWAVGSGLMVGTGNNTLDPQGKATKAQAATVLMRSCINNMKIPASIFPD